ncbi:ParB/RepB/Spo0J family partition protein [Actinosynnema sp. ALI-1.44]|uniref:ParB/RepB/Spo0J family partition protein n=1 Tax=Actinosynnema sp. ALI-1.44 TaxID=1933779 RepID=UPI000A069281|nr:ParB N-terminal domain-containing protein [Actinosynnema sp. ALI-1.44]
MTNFAAVSLPREEFDCLETNTSAGPVVRIPIRALRVAGSPRTAGENLEHVRALADTPDELPPIIVHRATMRVIDGVHRLRAARLRNQPDIAVRFFDGDEADAFVLAVRANVAHGLPLSLAERKAAAKSIVTSHPHWSDRLIASVTGLSAKTIGEVRRNGGVPQPESRVGQDGRVRPINSLEKRRLAMNLMRQNPDLSLRQVAKAAGISPETARAVRSRLQRGEDPTVRKPSNTRKTDEKRQSQTRIPQPLQLPDRVTIMRYLRTDPTLRFSETGRTLLRLLDVHAMSNDKWALLVRNVPPHARGSIAQAAMECARVWRTVAEQLERTAGPR